VPQPPLMLGRDVIAFDDGELELFAAVVLERIAEPASDSLRHRQAEGLGERRKAVGVSTPLARLGGVAGGADQRLGAVVVVENSTDNAGDLLRRPARPRQEAT